MYDGKSKLDVNLLEVKNPPATIYDISMNYGILHLYYIFSFIWVLFGVPPTQFAGEKVQGEGVPHTHVLALHLSIVVISLWSWANQPGRG